MDEEEKKQKKDAYAEIMRKVMKELESPDLDEELELVPFLEKLGIDYNLYKDSLKVSERGIYILSLNYFLACKRTKP